MFPRTHLSLARSVLVDRSLWLWPSVESQMFPRLFLWQTLLESQVFPRTHLSLALSVLWQTVSESQVFPRTHLSLALSVLLV